MTTIADSTSSLTTPHLADACVKLDVGLSILPGLAPVAPSMRVVGRAVPVVHRGSVDVFLEVLGTIEAGDVLVIDNQGRSDEGCIGDLVVREAQLAGAGGLCVFGSHRDTLEIEEIGLPVFSLGSIPVGPRRVDPREAEDLDRAFVGEVEVNRANVIAADRDGALAVPADRIDEVVAAAAVIAATERRQAQRMRAGESLRAQLDFEAYLKAREEDPALTFRTYLGTVGGAIET